MKAFFLQPAPDTGDRGVTQVSSSRCHADTESRLAREELARIAEDARLMSEYWDEQDEAARAVPRNGMTAQRTRNWLHRTLHRSAGG